MGRVRQRRGRQGFTLIELMLALTLGIIAFTSVYAVSKNSSHFFHQQYRVSNTMSRLRIAMAQVKRDFQRAGYLATANASAPNEPMCGAPAAPLQTAAWRLAGIMQFVNGVGDDVNNGMDPGKNYVNMLPADQIMLLANYETSAQYPAARFDLANPSRIFINRDWYGFQRDFTAWDTGVFSLPRFQSVFTVGRPVRILTAQRRKHFAIVTANGQASAAQDPFIEITPAVPAGCRNDVMAGAVAPLKPIRYLVQRGVAKGTGAELDAAETRPQLRRQEYDLRNDTPMADGENSVVLDFVVAFDVQIMAVNTPGAIPDNVVWGPDNLAIANRPQDLRMAQITLAARSPTIDPTFLHGGAGDPQPFRRFVLDPFGAAARPGSARVRRLRADVFLGNMAISN